MFLPLKWQLSKVFQEVFQTPLIIVLGEIQQEPPDARIVSRNSGIEIPLYG